MGDKSEQRLRRVPVGNGITSRGKRERMEKSKIKFIKKNTEKKNTFALCSRLLAESPQRIWEGSQREAKGSSPQCQKETKVGSDEPQ
ncbi:hypothetical protein TNCV_3398511 [Trichonephila clavipes]|nr:hypothetical protein TNCV_3398511 [Trichonephila clavipes]